MSKPALFLTVVGCVACALTLATLRQHGARTRDAMRVTVPLGLPTQPSFDSLVKEEVELGRLLFFDSKLSSDGSLSCASCHLPEHGFAEPRAKSHGIGRNARRRNTISLLNVAFQPALGWDGRFASFADQLHDVFSVDGDMGVTMSDAARALVADQRYRGLFRHVYAQDPDVPTFARALTAFQKTLLSGNSRVDRFLLSHDSAALSSTEQRGWELFTGKAGCAGCHTVFYRTTEVVGALLFTNHSFHNLGVGYVNGRMRDRGVYEQTRIPRHLGAFKTPSLRDVALTAPYMHDGSLATLEDVVRFYDRGGNLNPGLTVGLKPLHLRPDERAALVAFLGALTGERLREAVPTADQANAK